MNNPRILFIVPLPPPVHGSAMVSQYIKDCKELQNEFQCDFINLSTSRNIDEIGKKSLKKYWRFIAAYLILFWRLLTNKYSLCYLAITCHGIGFLKDAPFILLCKIFRKKVVIHQHNKGMSKCVDKAPYKWLLPLVYRNTKVILLSWHLYSDIAKVVKKEQVIICPNGIPEITNDEQSIERCNKETQLLFLSNLIPSKGVYVLLDACKILKDRGCKFMCNFVGGESKHITKEIFEKAINERGLNEYIKYNGAKYGNEKIAYFTQTNIFVQPTFDDCFPLTLLEAMQHKLPIITTNIGAISDIVKNGENGYIVSPKDSLSLADAIEKLITNKDLQIEMGEYSYKLYKENFTLKKFNNNIATILKDICHSS